MACASHTSIWLGAPLTDSGASRGPCPAPDSCPSPHIAPLHCTAQLPARRSIGVTSLVTINRWLVLALEEEERAEAEVRALRASLLLPARACRTAWCGVQHAGLSACCPACSSVSSLTNPQPATSHAYVARSLDRVVTCALPSLVYAEAGASGAAADGCRAGRCLLPRRVQCWCGAGDSGDPRRAGHAGSSKVVS